MDSFQMNAKNEDVPLCLVTLTEWNRKIGFFSIDWAFHVGDMDKNISKLA